MIISVAEFRASPREAAIDHKPRIDRNDNPLRMSPDMHRKAAREG